MMSSSLNDVRIEVEFAGLMSFGSYNYRWRKPLGTGSSCLRMEFFERNQDCG